MERCEKAGVARRSAVVLAWLLAFAFITSAMAVRPALACSCAEPSLQELVGRHPQVAVAVVRRIDRDGGATGVGSVEHTLRGNLPPQVPLQLDDGASCRPYLGVGQIATLSFEPAGDSWRTVECGMLDAGSTFAEAFGALRPEPEARGDPAVALVTDLPGAQLVLLDAKLAVLATAELADTQSVQACGDALLVTMSDGERGAVALVSIPELEPIHQRRLRRMERVLDARCDREGSVVAVTVSERMQRTLALYPDLMSGKARELPSAEDAVIRDGEVLLLRSDNDSRRSVLAAHAIATGHTVDRRTFDGMAASSMEASPDGDHLVIRGYAEESVLLVVHAPTGAIVGRTGGSWMPPEEDAWVNSEHLILQDENRGMGELPAGARMVDLRLAEVGRMPPVAPWQLVAGGGVITAVRGAELTVVSADGVVRTSADPRTAAAADVAVLGQVSPADGDADGTGTSAILPDPVVPEPRGRGVSALAIIGAVAAAVMVFAVLRLRRRRG